MSKTPQFLQQNLLKILQQSLHHKQLFRLQSPQLLSHINQTRQQDYPSLSHKNQQLSLEQLLKTTHGPSIKRINDNREKYREIKQKILTCMTALSKTPELSLSQILQWKQTILTTFLNQFLVQISKECKQKSQILIYIWNTIFNIVDYLFDTITKMNEKQEKKYLESILSNHTSYQSIIDNIKAKLTKKEEQRKRQEEFIKVLVYNLRYKRKEIKKLTKNLKLCTVKLNEFKDFYLDLQLEHIQLLSENREISKENALNLLKRKQEINHEKRKEYKLKQSHKRIRFQIENEIDNENENEGENVNKLNDELQSAFNRYYFDEREDKSMKDLQNVAQCLFENALDDFNVRIDDIPETQTIIDFKNNITFMDAATDMIDFVRDNEDKEVQITFNDRLLDDMIMHAAMQTVEFKPKTKVFEDLGIQVQEIELKILKLTRVKVIDRSYLLEDYREKNKKFKLQGNPIFKTKTEQYLKSMREIHYYDNNKKTVELLDYELQSDQQFNNNSIQVQTNDACILNFNNIPPRLRNAMFEKEVYRYVDRVQRFSIDIQQNEEIDEDITSKSTKKLRNILKRGNRRNLLSDTLNQQQRDKSLPTSFHTNTDNSTAKLSTNRSKNHQSSFGEPSTLRKSKLKFSKNSSKIFEIKQSHFEQLISHSKNDDDLKAPQKFWVTKKDTEQLSKDKRRFLYDLNLSDKLLDKLNHNFEYTPENKKLLLELEKLSEQLSSNKTLFDLLQNSISQNIHILKEQLRKMLNKKRNSRKLPLSRQKALTKIISLVYTYAYHLYLNHEKPLINLIIPLFHYFKIGYGEIKKNDLYLRMLYFLSQTICHREEYYIFETFILFLGLNLDDTNKLKIGKENTCLYLKLLSNLSINFKFPLNVEQLYTTLGYLDKKCREILLEQKYEANIIQKVIQRVKVKLHSLINDGETYTNIDTCEYGEIKINVFKCCQFIIEELEKIKSIVFDSYTHIYDYFTHVEGLKKEMFINYIIKNLYISRSEKMSKLKILQTSLKENLHLSNQNYLYKVINIFLQLNIIDFNKMYFMALSKYRIKEEFLYLSINRRYNFLIKYVELHREDFLFQSSLIKHLLNREEKNITKEVMNKKVMGLAYLQIVEFQTDKLLTVLLGPSLLELYTLESN